MCHDPASRPPSPPWSLTDLDSSGELRLTAGDGAVLAAFEAIPVGDPRARIVVLPDVRGLHPYYRALTETLAQTGLHACAIDYFARTAGAQLREDGFDYQPHLAKLTPESVGLDVAAAVTHLNPEGAHPVFTLGFCFGGGQSWALAASDLRLAGAIGFYGIPALLAERIQAVHAPLLMLIAGADRATSLERMQDIAEQLRTAGKDVEAHVYPDAPHSFFDRQHEAYAFACTDAWQRVLSFLDRHAGPAGD